MKAGKIIKTLGRLEREAISIAVRLDNCDGSDVVIEGSGLHLMFTPGEARMLAKALKKAAKKAEKI